MDKKTILAVIKGVAAEVLWSYKTQTGTTTRWAWIQLLSSVAFFFIALSLAIIALVYSIHGVFNIAGLITAGIAIFLGLISIFLALRMGYYWYSIGSEVCSAV